MKKFFLLFIILIFKSHSLYAQEKHVFNAKINKDSLYSKLEYMIPDEQKKEYKEMFSKADDGGKEYLLMIMYNGQKGGKKYLIDNFEAHKMQIMKLRNQYEKLNFSNYIVTVSYDNNVLYIPSTHITITIYKIKEGYLNDEILDRNANLDYIGTYSGTNEKAPEIKKALDVLRWNNKVLNEIISLIKDANVISIRNGNPVQIEVHPNFSAMYSYKIYRENLNKQQIIEYNDGCNYLHYKDNIVLHNGAPSGVLCFEK